MIYGVRASNEESAWGLASLVTLTAPTDRPSALGMIEVGLIQQGSQSQHTASYGTANVATSSGGTANVSLVRNGFSADTVGLDWLFSPAGPAPFNKWPWYNTKSVFAPPATLGTNTATAQLVMGDNPTLGVPAQWSPTNVPNPPPDPNYFTSAVGDGTVVSEQLPVLVAAHTKDRANLAFESYFQYASATVSVNVRWPVRRREQIVALPTPANQWSQTTAVNEFNRVDVNLTPAIILWGEPPPGSQGFLMWNASPSPPGASFVSPVTTGR